MPQGQTERQPKTSLCYFSIGTLVPDTTEPWSGAKTAVLKNSTGFVALEVPPRTKCDMSWQEPRSEDPVMAVELESCYSCQLSVDTNLHTHARAHTHTTHMTS